MFLPASWWLALGPFSRLTHGIASACARDPVLYVAGSRDRIVPSWNAEEVVRELPSTKVVTIDGPHLALYTNPAAAVHAIVGFIRDGISA